MRKTILRAAVFVFVISMLLCGSAAQAANKGKYGENLTWEIRNHVLTISGEGPMADMGFEKRPWWINRDFDSVVIGEGVTSIGQNAFFCQKEIISVSIPDSVTKIGDYAFFRCEKLESITIPENVTDIGRNAFAGCGKLQTPVPEQHRIPSPGTVEDSKAGVLEGCDFRIEESPDGFTFPVFYRDDPERVKLMDDKNIWYKSIVYVTEDWVDITENVTIDVEPYVFEEEDVLRTWETHMSYWDANYPFAEEEIIMLDGSPARLVIWAVDGTDPYVGEVKWQGEVEYLRNDRQLICSLNSWSENNDISLEDLPKVTMEDLRKIAEHISYDASKAPYTVADGEFTIRAKGEPVVPAGGQMQVTAEYRNEEKMLAKKKDFDWFWKYYKDPVTQWSVVDPESGKEILGVTINDKGTLRVDKKHEGISRVEIRGKNTYFYTKAALPIMIIPASSKITIDPACVFFYTGTNTPQTVRAVIEPETVPPVGLEWKLKKEGVAELSDAGDGSATLTPTGTGKTTLTVTDPNGKRAEADIRVVDPVTALTLTMKGKTKPGATVTFSPVFEPTSAGNKEVEWTLDVGAEIATLSDKGQVKISKDAPVGTRITITCKALGAPEPVSTSTEIEVTEK